MTYEKDSRRFLLMGNGPVSNHGCEAVVLGTRRILEREFGAADFLLASFAEDSPCVLPTNVLPVALPCHCSRWSRAWFAIKARGCLGLPENKTSFLKPLKRRPEAVRAALSIGGDGYNIDYGHFIVDRLLVMDRYIQSLGIPVLVWGASIGPFDSEPEFEREMADHLKGVELVVVREPVSFQYLKRLGLEQNLRLAPDPAFALEPVSCDLPSEVSKLLEQPCVGVNLSPLIARHRTNGDAAEWARLATRIVEQLLAVVEFPIVLIPHVFSNYGDERTDDELFLQRIRAALPEESRQRTAITPRSLNCENLKWVISRTVAFMGARTHSTIAAMSGTVPCISIAYSRKAWGINEWVHGHTKWVLRSDRLDPKEIGRKFRELLDQRHDVKAHLQRLVPGMVAQAYRVAEDVRMIVDC